MPCAVVIKYPARRQARDILGLRGFDRIFFGDPDWISLWLVARFRRVTLSSSTLNSNRILRICILSGVVPNAAASMEISGAGPDGRLIPLPEGRVGVTSASVGVLGVKSGVVVGLRLGVEPDRLERGVGVLIGLAIGEVVLDGRAGRPENT